MTFLTSKWYRELHPHWILKFGRLQNRIRKEFLLLFCGEAFEARMEKEQELEWDEAQKIVVSEDLVAAAKQQLKFLAEVDNNRYLYDGPVLDRPILR